MNLIRKGYLVCGPGSSVGTATVYGLDGLGIEFESRWERDFPHLSRPALGPIQPPVQLGTGPFPGVKSGRGVTLTPHSLLVPWSRKGRATLPMGRTACTEPQCLYKGALYLTFLCALHFLRQAHSFLRIKRQRTQHATIVTLFVHFLNCCDATRFDNCSRNCIRRSSTIIFYRISVLADLFSSFPMTGTSYKH